MKHEEMIYRGHSINYNYYGQNEFIFDINGDDIKCKDIETTLTLIDTINSLFELLFELKIKDKIIGDYTLKIEKKE